MNINKIVKILIIGFILFLIVGVGGAILNTYLTTPKLKYLYKNGSKRISSSLTGHAGVFEGGDQLVTVDNFDKPKKFIFINLRRGTINEVPIPDINYKKAGRPFFAGAGDVVLVSFYEYQGETYKYLLKNDESVTKLEYFEYNYNKNEDNTSLEDVLKTDRIKNLKVMPSFRGDETNLNISAFFNDKVFIQCAYNVAAKSGCPLEYLNPLKQNSSSRVKKEEYVDDNIQGVKITRQKDEKIDIYSTYFNWIKEVEFTSKEGKLEKITVPSHKLIAYAKVYGDKLYLVGSSVIVLDIQ